MELLLAFAAITFLFAILLILKRMLRWRFCVICTAIALTWISLLLLLKLGYFDNALLVALLLGQSVAGLYYLAEKRLHPELMVLRLPGLLTLTFAAYWAVAGFETAALLLLAGLWAIGGLLYAYRAKPRLKSIIDSILACCRDW